MWNASISGANKGFWIDDVSVMDGPPPAIPPHQFLWTGVSSAVWNFGLTANWSDLTTGANPVTYLESATNVNGLQAIFDDSSAVNTVTISTNVQPTQVVFSNTVAYTLSGTGVGGSAQIQKYNTGNLTLTGVNTNTGGVTINGGAVIVSSDASLGGSAANLTLAGGTLQVTANLTNTRPVLATGNSTILVDGGATLQLGGKLASATAVTAKDGPGTLIITNGGNFRFHGINGTVLLDRQAAITNRTLVFPASD